MGYFLTTEPENAVPPKSWVSPKTHTPGSRVSERGLRYYQTESGRWVNRDPIGERGFENLRNVDSFMVLKSGERGPRRKNTRPPSTEWMQVIRKLEDQSVRLKNNKLLANPSLKPVYLMVANDPMGRIDPLGLDSPGCDWVDDRVESPCVLAACAQHDACYDNNDCGALSWICGTFSLIPTACGVCNDEVLGRLTACAIYDDGSEWDDRYYCAVHHFFFDDPLSEHMSHSTD